MSAAVSTLRRVGERLSSPGAAAALLLAGAAILAFLFRARQAERLATPQLLCDEFIYADLAKNLASEGRLLLRDQPTYTSLLYPALLAPSWLADSMETTYRAAKTTNAALMTVTVLPLYLWGRSLLSPAWALLAPLLTLLLPQALFVGLLLTESAFLPTFIFATYAAARALERPTLGRQALFVLAAVLATAVRYQGLVLLAILPAALLLMAFLELRSERPRQRLSFIAERVRPFWPTLALLAGLLAVYLVARTAFHASLPAYEDVIAADYSAGAALRSTTVQAAHLFLVAGLIPISALLLLVLMAGRGDGGWSRAERAFLAVATASVTLLTVEVGMFNSHFLGTLSERYVFYVLPIAFLALAVWLARGLPRPFWPTAAAAIAPAALVVAQPLGEYLSEGLLPSNPGLFAFAALAGNFRDGVEDVVWLIRVGGVVAAAAFALLWRPAARVVIPLGLAAFLLLSTRPAAGHMRQLATASRSDVALGAEPEWVTRAVGDEEVAFLYRSTPDGWQASRTMLEVNFWNPSIRTVLSPGDAELCPLPERRVRVDPATGRFVASSLPPYLVVDRGLELTGRPVASNGGLILQKVPSSPGLTQSIEDVYPDGWMGGSAAYTRYAGSRPGIALVTLTRENWGGKDVPGAVRIDVGPLVLGGDGGPRMGRLTAKRRWTIHAQARREFRIPAPKPPFRIEVHIEPTFAPSQFGLPDARQLGAQVAFAFEEGEA